LKTGKNRLLGRFDEPDRVHKKIRKTGEKKTIDQNDGQYKIRKTGREQNNREIDDEREEDKDGMNKLKLINLF